MQRTQYKQAYKGKTEQELKHKEKKPVENEQKLPVKKPQFQQVQKAFTEQELKRKEKKPEDKQHNQLPTILEQKKVINTNKGQLISIQNYKEIINMDDDLSEHQKKKIIQTYSLDEIKEQVRKTLDKLQALHTKPLQEKQFIQCQHKLLLEETKEIYSLACSHSQNLLAFGTFAINVFDIKLNRVVKYIEGHKNRITSLCFQKNDQILVSASMDKSIRIWNLNTLKCIHIIKQSQIIFSISLSANYSTLISGSFDSTLHIWSLENQECIKTINNLHNKSIIQVLFSSKNTFVACVSDDESISILNGTSFAPIKDLHSIHNPFQISHIVSFSLNEKQLVVSGPQKNITLFETEYFNIAKVIENAHDSFVRQVYFLKNNKQLVSGDQNGLLKIWDIKSSHCLEQLEGHKEQVNSLVEADDKLYSVGTDKTLRAWKSYSTII